jgi:hypothetical protein
MGRDLKKRKGVGGIDNQTVTVKEIQQHIKKFLTSAGIGSATDPGHS